MPSTTGKRSTHLRKSMHPLVAQEFYIYEVVSNGLARVFYQEFEQRKKKEAFAARGASVEFRFHDVVFFFVKAAAEGITGNLAYDALKHLIARVRKPKREIGSGTFSAVVKRNTYDRLLKKKHPGAKRLANSVEVQRELEKQYELIVSVRWKYPNNL
jgi:hypothetical protein